MLESPFTYYDDLFRKNLSDSVKKPQLFCKLRFFL